MWQTSVITNPLHISTHTHQNLWLWPAHTWICEDEIYHWFKASGTTQVVFDLQPQSTSPTLLNLCILKLKESPTMFPRQRENSKHLKGSSMKDVRQYLTCCTYFLRDYCVLIIFKTPVQTKKPFRHKRLSRLRNERLFWAPKCSIVGQSRPPLWGARECIYMKQKQNYYKTRKRSQIYAFYFLQTWYQDFYPLIHTFMTVSKQQQANQDLNDSPLWWEGDSSAFELS